jgi:lichenan operon transcriptional antiterminator
MDKSVLIIDYLNNAESYVTLKKIAFDCGISVRTVQYYLKNIKNSFPDSVETGQQGVRLLKRIDTASHKPRIPENYEERKLWIFRKTLLDDQTLDMNWVAEYLCVSYLTLQNEINRMRKEIEPNKLRIQIRNDQISFNGKERDKKAFISKMIYKESSGTILSMDSLNKLFPKFDAYQIRHLIREQLNRERYYIDEYSLINLLLHILVSLNRYTLKIEEEEKNYFKEKLDVKAHFAQIIDNICDAIEKKYDNKFTMDEKFQFYVLLNTRARRERKEEQNSTDIAVLTNAATARFLEKIIAEIMEIYNVNLDVDGFKIAFAIHLKNMLIRLEQNVCLNNPLLEDIKITAPFIYDMAVYTTSLISKEIHMTISEDEISYIALHIGARLEEIKNSESKLSTVIVCPQYYTYAKKQLKTLFKAFEGDIFLLEILTNPEEIHFIENVDLIITTVALGQVHTGTNQLHISNFFSERDKKNIQNKIYYLKRQKEIGKFRGLFQNLFERRLYFYDLVYQDQNEAINAMCAQLVRFGYTNDGYVDKVNEREKISPTNFGRIAIPHPIDSYSDKTIIEVATLKKPIQWNSSQVSLIFLIALRKEDYPKFQDVFTFLTNVFLDNKSLDKIMKASDYDMFIKTMSELYENTVNL